MLYGDSYLDVNYSEILRYYNKVAEDHALMVIMKNDNKFDKSNVYFNGDGFSYSKCKPNENSQYIDFGLSIMTKQHFKKTEDFFDLSELQENLSSSNSMKFFESKMRFYEIGSYQGFSEFEDYIVDKYASA